MFSPQKTVLHYANNYRIKLSKQIMNINCADQLMCANRSTVSKMDDTRTLCIKNYVEY